MATGARSRTLQSKQRFYLCYISLQIQLLGEYEKLTQKHSAEPSIYVHTEYYFMSELLAFFNNLIGVKVKTVHNTFNGWPTLLEKEESCRCYTVSMRVDASFKYIPIVVVVGIF